MIKQNRLPVILCLCYCFIEILLSTEIVYLIQGKYLSFIKYIFAICAFLYFLILLFNTKLGKSELYLFLFLLVAVGVILFAKSLHIFMLVIFLYLFRNYKFEHLLKAFYVMLWIALALTVLLSLTNIYPNINHSRQGITRHALGFATPTLGQSVLLFLLISKFYISKRNMSVLSILLYAGLMIAMYHFTAGRTGFYLGVLAIFVIIMYKIFGNEKHAEKFFKNNVIKVIFISIPLICLFLSLLMTKLFADANAFAIKLNEMLSTRLLLQKNAFAERNIFLFGQKIDWFNEFGIYIGIDNSYFYHLFNYGIIVFAFSLAYYCFIIKIALKNKDYCFVLIALIILFDALFEPYLIDFKYNFFIFYPILFKNKKEEHNRLICKACT